MVCKGVISKCTGARGWSLVAARRWQPGAPRAKDERRTTRCQCSVFPSSKSSACGSRSMTEDSASTAPAGLPGRFRIKLVPRVPHSARLSAANLVFFMPSARIRSAIPSTRRSQTARVASGVTSRNATPVPPVVTTRRAERQSSISLFWIEVISSATMERTATGKFRPSSSSATAGPETSDFSPREQESLTVRTAAAIGSGVEEDIFSLGRVAVRLVEQAQPFHQQALSVESSRLLRGLSVKVDFEIALSPAQHFENRFVSGDRTVGRVLHLPLVEIHLAFVVTVGHSERTALAAHLEGLHQVHHIHLGEASAQDAVRGRGFRHLLERNPVDDAFDALGRVLEEEWLFDRVLKPVL